MIKAKLINTSIWNIKGLENTKTCLNFQQLTKVGLPMNVVSGVNPLTNGLINPTGNS